MLSLVITQPIRIANVIHLIDGFPEKRDNQCQEHKCSGKIGKIETIIFPCHQDKPLIAIRQRSLYAKFS